MDKTFIRKQIAAMATVKENELVQQYQKLADAAKAKWLAQSDFGEAYTFLCRVPDQIHYSLNIIKESGIKVNAYVNNYADNLNEYWHIEKQLVNPYESRRFYQYENPYIADIVQDYTKAVTQAREEYRRIKDIIASVPAKKAFDILKKAGIPLHEPEAETKDIVALNAITFDFSKLGVKREVQK